MLTRRILAMGWRSLAFRPPPLEGMGHPAAPRGLKPAALQGVEWEALR